MDKKRSYDEGCAAAHGLDLIGERWALLVVRELLLGPKRFTDLRASLPHVSPNVLSQRLRDLEAIGVVRHHKLPPPAASQVYELTDWGTQLEPVIMALGRWAARSPSMPFASPTSVTSLIIAFQTMFDPHSAEGFDASFELRLGDERFSVRVEDGRLEIVQGRVNQPDAIIESDTGTLKALAFGGWSLHEALEAGALTMTGDEASAQRLFKLFKLPEPVIAVGSA
ncbi:MAG: Transcriptional regulator, HxlR family [uncultured Truepera sp.]|uniref:Transcriptional regulator, HxlR family n=1 Tax=uncultured Truepera sp. TaxID=543023 RepID=A0A6J4VHM3_9DEIN|nr:MAG: Transcriptional regulator, HxlR family [uncultured Truepera sp.]